MHTLGEHTEETASQRQWCPSAALEYTWKIQAGSRSDPQSKSLLQEKCQIERLLDRFPQEHKPMGNGSYILIQ